MKRNTWPFHGFWRPVLATEYTPPIQTTNPAMTVLSNIDYKDKYIWAATWENQQSEFAPNEDSDQPGHPPSLIRIFAVRLEKARVLSYPLSAQQRFWSDWVDAQADLSLRYAHMPFCWFCHDAAHMSWNSQYTSTTFSQYFHGRNSRLLTYFSPGFQVAHLNGLFTCCFTTNFHGLLWVPYESESHRTYHQYFHNRFTTPFASSD